MQIDVDGHLFDAGDVPAGASLLEVLRDVLGVRSPKDGCSPQGQCGCCTVLVDGAPRVACVTPAARVAGRRITTVDGLAPERRQAWAEALTATGGSQCGFCTPGIVVRLEAAVAQGLRAGDRAGVDRALLAHLCRCTGWQTIREACDLVAGGAPVEPVLARDLDAAARRATLEGGTAQVVGPPVALGRGGFADDTAPVGTPVAVRAADGGWVLGDTLGRARAEAGKVQGRRSTVALSWPLEVPPGDWALTLRTTWVEPAYLEPDASWWDPTGDAPPAGPLANGGAFGSKVASPLPEVARRLAAEAGRAVRAQWSREDVVREGPKRPPLAAGLRRDGTGVVRVVRTDGVADAIRSALPDVDVVEVDVAGPPTSAVVRGAGWAEAAVLAAVLAGPVRTGEDPVRAAADGVEVVDRRGGRARVALALGPAGEVAGVRVQVHAGAPLDRVVLRSYCIGAVHQGLGWVRSEGIGVDADGVPVDLTIRSFGILRAQDMPPVEVEVVEPADDGPGAEPVAVSDAVFAATAAAAWMAAGLPPAWPVERS